MKNINFWWSCYVFRFNSVNKYAEDAEPESLKLQFCDWQENSTIIKTKSLKDMQSPNVDAILSPYSCVVCILLPKKKD
jgi:hypothetical protein